MLTIGFIFPSSDYLHDPFRGDPHTHFQVLTVIEYYFQNKVELHLIDLRGIKKEFALYHIPQCDVFLYSAYTLDIKEQLITLQNLKYHYPASKHIAGGPHTSVFQDECLKYFDALILGECEDLIVDVINDINSLKLQKIYRQITPIDINKYPIPSRRYLPKTTIARKGLMSLKSKRDFDDIYGTTVIFSRGCPYQCYFCAMPQLKHLSSGVRYRNPQFVKNEIEYLKHDYNIKGINLLDEIGIPLNPKFATEYLEAIGSTDIVWRGQCRVDGISADIARLAGNSGCVAMGLGVESVSQRSLDMINKNIDINKAKETIRLLKDNNIETRIYMIMGLPGEPDDIVEKTWDFIQETKPDIVILSLFTVRPGTEIYDNFQKFGIRKLHTDWDKTMHMYGRYEHELPSLTFEYEKNTPWGRGFSSEQILNNYVKLQSRLREHNLSSIPEVANNNQFTQVNH